MIDHLTPYEVYIMTNTTNKQVTVDLGKIKHNKKVFNTSSAIKVILAFIEKRGRLPMCLKIDASASPVKASSSSSTSDVVSEFFAPKYAKDIEKQSIVLIADGRMLHIKNTGAWRKSKEAEAEAEAEGRWVEAEQHQVIFIDFRYAVDQCTNERVGMRDAVRLLLKLSSFDGVGY